MILVFSPEKSFGQTPIETFDTFIETVKSSNLELMSLRYNVDISKAELRASRILPDPELSVSYYNNDNPNMKLGYGVETELNYTLEMGGKRKARVALAQSSLSAQEILFDFQFRQLIADASLAYLEAIRNQSLLDNAKDSYLRMQQIAEADSLRFSKGAISETDFKQSRLEAKALQNEVLQAATNFKNSLFTLSLLKGLSPEEALPIPQGNLEKFLRSYSPDTLVRVAKEFREDLKLAKQNIDYQEKSYQMVKADQRLDLGIALGANFNSEVTNEVSPSEPFNGLSAGLSIPLKFSNLNKGKLQAARFSIKQAQINSLESERQIEKEVIQSLTEYESACKQVMQFTRYMLQEAESILNGKIFAYERGETGLIEVLNAHRTFNEIRNIYINALHHRASSLVELQRVCGIWDIVF